MFGTANMLHIFRNVNATICMSCKKMLRTTKEYKKQTTSMTGEIHIFRNKVVLYTFSLNNFIRSIGNSNFRLT